MKKHPRLLSLFAFITLIIFVIVPVVPLLLSSLSFGWRWPAVLPESWSFRAWEYVLNDVRTWQAVGISIWISLIVTAANILLAIPAANALMRYPVRGRWLFEAIIFAPIIIPPFISVMGIHLTFLRLGLTETVVGVVLAHIAPTLPYMFRAVMISYQTLSADWEDQARMLGARALPRFFHVVLPHLLPGIMAGASLSVLISLSQYLITFIIGAGQVVTLPILLFPFVSGGDPGIASAYSLLYAAIAIAALVGMDAALKRYYQLNKASQDQVKGVKL